MPIDAISAILAMYLIRVIIVSLVSRYRWIQGAQNSRMVNALDVLLDTILERIEFVR